MTTYKPGRLTCEPFRQYNTQGNGIYGPSPRTPAQWQSFSNWCPGDIIDIRRINLGAVTAGSHSFKIRVPTAVFAAGQGDIPVSLYLQGKTSGNLPADLYEEEDLSTFVIYPNPSNGNFTIENFSQMAQEITVTDMMGKQVMNISSLENKVDFFVETKGVFVVSVKTKEGTGNKKIIVN